MPYFLCQWRIRWVFITLPLIVRDYQRLCTTASGSILHLISLKVKMIKKILIHLQLPVTTTSLTWLQCNQKRQLLVKIAVQRRLAVVQLQIMMIFLTRLAVLLLFPRFVWLLVSEFVSKKCTNNFLLRVLSSESDLFSLTLLRNVDFSINIRLSSVLGYFSLECVLMS